MVKYEDYRKDKNFKIDSLSYQEIFDSLKSGIEKTICDYAKVEKLTGLSYEDEDSVVMMKYGKDKDMYPHVIFMVSAYSDKWIYESTYYCVLNPFEVELHKTHNGEMEIITHEELTNCLLGMMNTKFANSDYLEKREKYFKNAELMQRKREELLFF